MCLGVPGRVVSVNEAVKTAVVDFFGIRREVCLEIVDEPVAPGDYILNHVGFAIRRIPVDDIQQTIAMYEELMREAPETDLMASDVRAEIEATGKERA
jgi:hydrogenase expression/formation protein HypC